MNDLILIKMGRNAIIFEVIIILTSIFMQWKSYKYQIQLEVVSGKQLIFELNIT